MNFFYMIQGTFLDFMSDLATAFRTNSINDDPYPSYPSYQPPRPVCSNSHGGRFTGEYMVTNGSRNGQEIYEGPNGGRYTLTASGKKNYKGT